MWLKILCTRFAHRFSYILAPSHSICFRCLWKPLLLPALPPSLTEHIEIQSVFTHLHHYCHLCFHLQVFHLQINQIQCLHQFQQPPLPSFSEYHLRQFLRLQGSFFTARTNRAILTITASISRSTCSASFTAGAFCLALLAAEDQLARKYLKHSLEHPNQ